MEWSRERFGAIYRDSLGAIRKIGSEPSKDSVRYTKRVTKTWQKNGVVNSIKGSRQIKQRQERDFVFIESREKVIDNLEKGCLGAMTGTVSWLMRIEYIVGQQMVRELAENNFLKDFGQEGEVWHWSVVFQDLGVKSCFLEKRLDDHYQTSQDYYQGEVTEQEAANASTLVQQSWPLPSAIKIRAGDHLQAAHRPQWFWPTTSLLSLKLVNQNCTPVRRRTLCCRHAHCTTTSGISSGC